MRSLLQTLYRITLKGVGALGILFVITFLMVVLPGDDPRDLLHPLPITLILILTATSLALTSFQARLPEWLVRPNRPWQSGLVIMAIGLLGLINMIAVMIPLTSIGLYLQMGDEVMRPLTINTTLLFGSLYALAVLLGVPLSLCPAPRDDATDASLA
jgi:hypothetical protein